MCCGFVAVRAVTRRWRKISRNFPYCASVAPALTDMSVRVAKSLLIWIATEPSPEAAYTVPRSGQFRKYQLTLVGRAVGADVEAIGRRPVAGDDELARRRRPGADAVVEAVDATDRARVVRRRAEPLAEDAETAPRRVVVAKLAE